MTLSIAARCSVTNQLGVAIASSSVCVGSRCAWVRAKAGAVLTQNITNPGLGVQGLNLLASGLSAEVTLAQLLQIESYPAYRQLLIIDRNGKTAQYTGEKALGIHAAAAAENCVAAGNLLANLTVPTAMVNAFRDGDGVLAARLLLALQAGLASGGEQGELRSAALLVVDQQDWPIIDLRVDWDDRPIAKLQQLWQIYQPQLPDYVTRAENPQAAPSYGVPGDP